MGKHEINYLKPQSILKFASIHLVSLEGEAFLMDKTVLAAASKLFCDLLLDQEDCNERVVFNTQIPKSHLGVFCQFVCSGTLPSNEFNADLVSSFNNLGINLEEGMKLDTVHTASLPIFDLSFSVQCFSEVVIKKEVAENGADDSNTVSTSQSTRSRKVKVEWDDYCHDPENDFNDDYKCKTESIAMDDANDNDWQVGQLDQSGKKKEKPRIKKR